ncbi:NAD(P)-binding protein [Rhizoclosmatium globosum]|uniref:NAD(P)-binding protein n=1 Tax=Rhizoclosmatium globosum TaxID=329046 RepID=A0A1Y2C1D1_9FUNG|nr:NAD(P)-binding protein [Rhizoclosmatium globosum]ORY40838.1 NAD(P)-binding protein [Rhizoclosmatium globosum]|eukprot:ORY25376.1 NAD(P)-binding protein [Rhizoclosmatium globosum]
MATTVFTAASTAEEVATAYQSQVQGKTILITGGNTGLGLETAKQLAGHGATVIFTSRSEKNGEAAVKTIKEAYPSANVTFLQMDLASVQSVKAFATQFLATYSTLNILINNAGVMACPKTFTTDGFETQFGVNHLGHFYLTQLLLPLLLKSASKAFPSRIVTLSSVGQFFYAPPEGIMFDDLNADQSYNSWVRYGHAKLANVLFAKEINARYASKNLISVAVHPGMVIGTDLKRHFDFWNVIDTVWQVATKPGALGVVMGERNKSIPEGASTTVLCAVGSDIAGGGFYYDCKISEGEKLHPLAGDADLAKRLWDVSEKLVADALKK